MSYLLIDAGNSRIKWRLWQQGEWLQQGSLETGQAFRLIEVVAELAQQFTLLPQVWVSNVAGETVAAALAQACPADYWSLHTIRALPEQCGVSNGYAQPAQLGSDRWAALVAAGEWLPQGLVVSCGTAPTIDALDANGGGLGGGIMPGMELMQQAVLQRTHIAAAIHGDYQSFPDNSMDAIASGALQATLGAIERQYRQLSQPAARVLLTGGNARRVQSHCTLPLQIVDNLVLHGLLKIARDFQRND